MSTSGTSHRHTDKHVFTDAALLARGRSTDVEARGVHCGQCRQLEYLPVPCPCGLQLCSECAATHQPTCQHYQFQAAAKVRMKQRLAPHCPACRATLRTPTVGFNCTDGEWEAAIHKRVGDHLASNCADFIYSADGANDDAGAAVIPGAASKKALKLKGPRCCAKGCKTKLIGIHANVSCVDCAQPFCLRHRFASDHACEGTPEAAVAKRKKLKQKKKSAETGPAPGAAGTAVAAPKPCAVAAAATTPWAAAALRRQQQQQQPVA